MTNYKKISTAEKNSNSNYWLPYFKRRKWSSHEF